MKVQFKEWNCDVRFLRYNNNRIAIQLTQYDEKGGYDEPIATATINLPDVHIPDGQVIVKSYSENEGMEQALLDAGIISKEVGKAATGYVTAPIYTLTSEALEEAIK